MKIYGLFLWAVETQQGNAQLWITTRRKDPALAIQKTKTFLKRSNREGETITLVKSHGFIDA